MRSFGRSITLTAYLVVAALLCLFAVAATTPQPHIKPAGTTRFPDPKASDARPSERKSDGPAIAPISLSDPDGQELILEDVSVRTAVEGMLSLTELELRFRNPKARRLEGRFQCTLPPNAAISRFAKEVNGQLMEGEVVERLRANQVYEQFLHQMRDPALLEQDQGNRFSARIFPIEANASVRVVLSYTTLLPLEHGQRTYSLPLRGIAKMNHFTFRAAITTLPGEETVGSEKSESASSSGLKHSTADVLTMEENDFTPQHDLELAFRPSASADRTRVLRAGDFYLAAFRPDVRETQAKRSGTWLFYVDTSASSAEGSEHRIHALETLLAALPADDRIEVKTFDNEVTSLAHGSAREVSRAIGGQLRARLFLGGTDVGALLRDVARAAQGDRTIVVASDLVPTLGTIDRKELSDLVKAIPPHAALHALVLGSREDGQMARTLTAGRGRVVRVPFTDSLEERARDAAAALSRPLGVSFDVADSQAEWVYPQHVDDVQPGDEIIVLGKSKAASEPAARLSGSAAATLSANSATRLPAGTFAPLLEREAYRAYLEYLADRESNEPSPAVREALANEQVKISVEQRVVIPQTTMLVLESEWDYQRFGLDRRALASILTVGAVGIERLDRSAPSVIAQQPWPKPPVPQPLPRPMPPMPMRDAVSGRAAAPAAEAAAAGSGFARADVQSSVISGAPAFDKDFMVDDAAPAAKSVAAVGSVAESIAPAPQQAPSSPPVTNMPSPVPPPPVPTSADFRQSHNPPPTRRREENQREAGNWTHPHRPTADEVDKLHGDVTANPADREAYNQLGEALASLGQWTALRTLALQWQPYDPENPQVYELLGTADDHLGNESEEARADASLIEIAPGKPELLQRAGLLLLRAHRASLAETPLRHALQLRPDRVNSYRHLALMLWQDGRTEEAARILESATHQNFPNWYGDAQRVVHEELGYVYRAWIAKEPSRRADIEQRARDYAVDLTRRDAIRVSLAWETDANDVDLHVVDPKGEECFYSHKETGTGLRLYEDITQGLGPEVIRTAKASAGTYQVGVRYFAAGPMGVSRGIVVVLRDTGNDASPSVDIYPFRLVQGGGEVRYVTALNVK